MKGMFESPEDAVTGRWASVSPAACEFVRALACNACCAPRWVLFKLVEANADDIADLATSPIAIGYPLAYCHYLMLAKEHSAPFLRNS